MSPRRSPMQPHEDPEQPRPERISLVSWSRVFIGLALIALAIIWSLINSKMGVSVQVAPPTSTPGTGATAPALGTVQHVLGRTVDAKALGVTGAVDGHAAPPGEQYLLLAVRVGAGGSALALAPGDFALHAGSRLIAHGHPYPGHAGLPPRTHLSAGSAIQGTLVFTVPKGVGTTALIYTPEGHPRLAVHWRLTGLPH